MNSPDLNRTSSLSSVSRIAAGEKLRAARRAAGLIRLLLKNMENMKDPLIGRAVHQQSKWLELRASARPFHECVSNSGI